MTKREFWLKLFGENNTALASAIHFCERFVNEESLENGKEFLEEKIKELDEEIPQKVVDEVFPFGVSTLKQDSDNQAKAMPTQKVVINTGIGSFDLSAEALEYMGMSLGEFNQQDESFRANPKLIECIENLGPKANGLYANLSIIEIPGDVEWEISEHLGREWIEEKHRIWK